jgi:hypothetical protein
VENTALPTQFQSHTSSVQSCESKRSDRFLLCLACAVGGVLFFFSVNRFLPAYQGFAVLDWVRTQHVERGIPGAYRISDEDTAFLSILEGGRPIVEGSATSAAFRLQGDILELQFRGGLPFPTLKTAHVILRTVDGQTLADERFPVPAPESWLAYRLRVPENFIGTAVTLEVHSKLYPVPGFAFALRDRVDFYRSSPLLSWQSYLQSPRMGELICLCLALVVAGVLFTLREIRPSWSALLGIFFVCGCVVHFRSSAYFFWDEWHVFGRFQELGFPGVVYTHNEHFLPLFFAWYFVQAKLFADCYSLFLLVSLLIHALNAVLLVRILSELGESLPGCRPLSLLLGFLFLISALHGESLHWAFEQSLLLNQTAMLLGYLCLLRFVKSGSLSGLGGCACAVVAAPLLFGNGFVLSAHLLLLCLAVGCSRGRHWQEIFKKKLLPLLAVCLFSAAIAAFLYLTHRQSAGHGIESAEQAGPFAHLREIAVYLFVGSEFGAVLRGVGFYPYLGPEELSSIFGAWPQAVVSPETLLAGFGLLSSLFFLWFSTRVAEHRRTSLCLWLLGQGIILSCMLLPSLGRWQLGAQQSLSLRYHYPTLVGVAIMLLPVLSRLWRAEEQGSKRGRCSTAVLFFLLAGYLALQLHVGGTFTYFSSRGFENRLYVEKLADWQYRLLAADQGQGAALLPGAEPAMPNTVAPGRSAAQIYAVLHWLDAKKYPVGH